MTVEHDCRALPTFIDDAVLIIAVWILQPLRQVPLQA